MIKVAGRVLSLVALAALATPVHGEDDFPLVGTYTENHASERGHGTLEGVPDNMLDVVPDALG